VRGIHSLPPAEIEMRNAGNMEARVGLCAPWRTTKQRQYWAMERSSRLGQAME